MTTLDRIAEEMTHRCMSLLRDHPQTIYSCVQRQLERGLSLTLEADSLHWTLTLARLTVAPSQAEADICYRAFQIPEQWQRTTQAGIILTPSQTQIKTLRVRWSRQVQIRLGLPVKEKIDTTL
jgi:hypothetical protein